MLIAMLSLSIKKIKNSWKLRNSKLLNSPATVIEAPCTCAVIFFNYRYIMIILCLNICGRVMVVVRTVTELF